MQPPNLHISTLIQVPLGAWTPVLDHWVWIASHKPVYYLTAPSFCIQAIMILSITNVTQRSISRLLISLILILLYSGCCFDKLGSILGFKHASHRSDPKMLGTHTVKSSSSGSLLECSPLYIYSVYETPGYASSPFFSVRDAHDLHTSQDLCTPYGDATSLVLLHCIN